MDKNQKIGLSLVVAVALLALFIGYTYKNSSKNATVPLSSPVVTSGFTTSTSTTPEKTVQGSSGSYVYSSPSITFTSALKLTVNVNTAPQFIASIKNAQDKTSFVEVLFDQPGECFLGECKKPAQSSETIHGIRWDFLGNPEYCTTPDNCSQPSALYRTIRNGRPVYLVFYAYGPKLDQNTILKSFSFK